MDRLKQHLKAMEKDVVGESARRQSGLIKPRASGTSQEISYLLHDCFSSCTSHARSPPADWNSSKHEKSLLCYVMLFMRLLLHH